MATDRSASENATSTVDVPPTTTMAARVFEHGGSDKLLYDEYPLDRPGPRDVVVKVLACSVSGWDIKYRAGLPQSFGALPGRALFPLPQQLGREAAGEVIAVGSEVEAFQIGARVVAVVHAEDPYSREAARGLGNLSTGIAIPGHQALGSYAQYLVRDEAQWLPLPDSVSLEQAAVTLWPFATSHRVVVDRLRLQPADVLIVAGATGGMGLATIQLARLMGARVIGLTRSPEKAAALREFGIDETVVLDGKDGTQRQLRELTGGYGAEHAVDYSGDPEILPVLVGGLALGGRLAVTSGEQHPVTLPILLRSFIALELTVLGVRGARLSDTRVVRDLLARGQIHTPIAARFPLSDVSEAHEWFERGRDRIGRIVLQPWGNPVDAVDHGS